MKKIFSFLAIAAVATTMFTSCGDKDDNGGGTTSSEAKLTLSADKLTVAVAAKGEFTVTSNIDAPGAILITVTSSDDKILKVDNASVTIAKGKKTIKGSYTGVAEGTAKIKIATATAGVTMTTDEVSVTVGTVVPPVDLETLLECDSDNTFSDKYFAQDATADGSFGFTLWHNVEVLLENAGCGYHGEALSLTAVDKGTDIAGLKMTANPEHIFMGTNGTDGYDSLPNFSEIGEAQYVVFNIVTTFVKPILDAEKNVTNPEDYTHDKPQTTGWALVSSDDGNSVILHAFKFPATKVGE